ncbi:25S rRNA (adenine2142-N1)-methyltransferase [Basidiobolus ranarum]|uniref:25S rRNA adenine-N(1) methyltransferase n=1 Tax=Basidiobolus ranarum TaxID=34480 RepID=A0ABR2W7B6_9FUNG
MPRPAKRKKPVTFEDSSLLKAKPTSFKKKTAQVIRRFHVLNKEVEKTNDPVKIEEIKNEMEKLGGLELYQRASVLGASKSRGGDTSKWLIQELSKIGIPDENKTKLALLDIGALSSENYKKQSSWIKTTAIDLNARDSNIIKQDFLEMEPPKEASGRFNIVCLSLVVNFVGDPLKRGIMISKTRDFLLPSGFLFFVVPLPCVTNSRYLNHEYLREFMLNLGFKLVSCHFAKKLAYYLFQLGKPTKTIQEKFQRKNLINDGPGRNNFSMMLP